MNETLCQTYWRLSPQNRFGVGWPTLWAALFLVFGLFPVPAEAQSDSIVSAPPLVYLAESSNESLNQRLRTLLVESFGDSIMLRSFTSGQTSQDSQSPVIAIGPSAFNRIRQENQQVPVLGILVREENVSPGDHAQSGHVSAVFSDTPLLRQAALGKAILPYSTRVAMLARPETESLYQPVLDQLPSLNMEGRVFIVPSDDRLIPTLIRALNYGDFILAASDEGIYNPRTIKHILLTAYRRNSIVIGPSQAYVKAGALASSFTPLSEVAESAADYVRQYWQTGAFPPPARPAAFGIEINRQVGRSLNIPLPERQTLIESVIQRLNEAEASSNE